MKEFAIIILLGRIIARLILLVIGVYIILYNGPELLFSDPIYGLLVVIFLYVVSLPTKE